jgi:hypothetical protein
MAVLDVNPESLGMVAVRCSALAAEVASISRYEAGSLAPGQATGAAVQTLHAGVGTAGQAIAARLEATAEKLAVGESAFLRHEQAAATALTMVASPGA